MRLLFFVFLVLQCKTLVVVLLVLLLLVLVVVVVVVVPVLVPVLVLVLVVVMQTGGWGARGKGAAPPPAERNCATLVFCFSCVAM